MQDGYQPDYNVNYGSYRCICKLLVLMIFLSDRYSTCERMLAAMEVMAFTRSLAKVDLYESPTTLRFTNMPAILISGSTSEAPGDVSITKRRLAGPGG